MAMTPKQKVYVKQMEEEVKRQRAVRDEMSVINDRWVSRCRAAETALADLVAATDEVIKPANPSGELYACPERRYDNSFAKLKAAVERARKVL